MTSLLDPCNSGTPVEDIIKALDQIREEVGSIHIKNQEKTTHKMLCIWHILEARRIPKVIDILKDDQGNRIISERDPNYCHQKIGSFWDSTPWVKVLILFLCTMLTWKITSRLRK